MLQAMVINDRLEGLVAVFFNCIPPPANADKRGIVAVINGPLEDDTVTVTKVFSETVYMIQIDYRFLIVAIREGHIQSIVCLSESMYHISS
jgi:hypothetical protein